MNKQQSNMLRSLKEVQEFLDEHASELPGVNENGMRTKFDANVAEITKLAATQTASDLAAQAATARADSVTNDLLAHHMKHIARIAKVTLPPGPELAPLALPSVSVRGERLAAVARGMATQASKFEATFIAAGLPADFVKQLRDKADLLSTLMTQRKQMLADRAAATSLLGEHIREAREVQQVIDGFVNTAAKENPKLLVTWQHLKRLRQPNKPAAPAAPEATPAAAA